MTYGLWWWCNDGKIAENPVVDHHYSFASISSHLKPETLATYAAAEHSDIFHSSLSLALALSFVCVIRYISLWTTYRTT